MDKDKEVVLEDIRETLGLLSDDPLYLVIYYAVRCTEKGTDWRNIAHNVLYSVINDLKVAASIITTERKRDD